MTLRKLETVAVFLSFSFPMLSTLSVVEINLGVACYRFRLFLKEKFRCNLT